MLSASAAGCHTAGGRKWLHADPGALDAVRIAWPDVPHLAYLGTQPDVEAMIDDQFRALLGGSDDRAERILDYPPGHFARARERARAKLKE